MRIPLLVTEQTPAGRINSSVIATVDKEIERLQSALGNAEADLDAITRSIHDAHVRRGGAVLAMRAFRETAKISAASDDNVYVSGVPCWIVWRDEGELKIAKRREISAFGCDVYIVFAPTRDVVRVRYEGGSWQAMMLRRSGNLSEQMFGDRLNDHWRGDEGHFTLSGEIYAARAICLRKR